MTDSVLFDRLPGQNGKAIGVATLNRPQALNGLNLEMCQLLFKQFQDNPSFKKWLSDLIFNLTYNKDGKPYEIPVQSRKN